MALSVHHARMLALRIDALRRRFEPLVAAILRRFFGHQANRAVERWAAGLEPIPADDAWRLYRALEPVLYGTAHAVGNAVAPSVGVSPYVDTDPILLGHLASSAQRVRRVTEETRSAIRRELLIGGERHYSPYQIATGVPKDDYRGLRAVVSETYRGRAETIARTEVALAAAASAADRYGVAGVAEVDIRDGEGCGWLRHDDPDKANGTRRLLSDYIQTPLSHPNCRRIAIPVLR